MTAGLLTVWNFSKLDGRNGKIVVGLEAIVSGLASCRLPVIAGRIVLVRHPVKAVVRSVAAAVRKRYVHVLAALTLIGYVHVAAVIDSHILTCKGVRRNARLAH